MVDDLLQEFRDYYAGRAQTTLTQLRRPFDLLVMKVLSLLQDGDPALAFGPKPDSSGHFSWSNGSRLYYANLTANLFNTKRDESFKGFEAIYVSRTDNVTAAAAGGTAGKNAC